MASTYFASASRATPRPARERLNSTAGVESTHGGRPCKRVLPWKERIPWLGGPVRREKWRGRSDRAFPPPTATSGDKIIVYRGLRRNDESSVQLVKVTLPGRQRRIERKVCSTKEGPREQPAAKTHGPFGAPVEDSRSLSLGRRPDDHPEAPTNAMRPSGAAWPARPRLPRWVLSVFVLLYCSEGRSSSATASRMLSSAWISMGSSAPVCDRMSESFSSPATRTVKYSGSGSGRSTKTCGQVMAA